MDGFLQGLTMGLAYVAPIGVQNLFVIHSSMEGTLGRALGTAGIIVFFDVTLALACFFGVGMLLQSVPALASFVLFAGSLVLLYMGGMLLRSGPVELRPFSGRSFVGTAGMACVVTWCNPQAIVDGTMMLGAFQATLPADRVMPFLCGVLSASCLWFTGLSLLVSLLRRRIHPRFLGWVNRLCGAVILVYGVRLFWRFLQTFF